MNSQLTERESIILKMWAIGAQAKTICNINNISINQFNRILIDVKLKYGVSTSNELRIIYLTQILTALEK